MDNDFIVTVIMAILAISFSLGIMVGGKYGYENGLQEGIRQQQEQCVKIGVARWIPITAISNNFEFVTNNVVKE